jgi:hypothetical protein
MFNIKPEFIFDADKLEIALITELKNLKELKDKNSEHIALTLSDIINQISIAIAENKKVSLFLITFFNHFGRIESDYFNKNSGNTISELRKFISNKQIDKDLFDDLKLYD